MTRVTRATRAKENALFNTAMEDSMEPVQLSSPPSTPAPAGRVVARKASKPLKIAAAKPNKKLADGTGSNVSLKVITPKSLRKQPKKSTLKVEDPDELPHNLGNIHSAPLIQAVKRESSDTIEASPKKRTKVTKGAAKIAIGEDVASDAKKSSKVKSDKTTNTKKASNYGHVWGQSPFPDYVRPTPEECHEVARLLQTIHREVHKPKEIPKASLTVAGCGEVPHILDALVRTRLSANTTNNNSARAFRGLIETFGTKTDPFGRESPNYDAIRRRDVKDCFEAIKAGGLADRKSKDIKKILDMVYEENQARKEALLSKDKSVEGEEKETEGEKAAEIKFASEDLLSLDYLHLFETKDAIEKLVTFPGIGMKTASCVALFCMQRPSFAVDTHVFRLCKWLGWVPPHATRDTTFSHCEVRIPDELKYPLHQLLIMHGKKCPRCRAITSKSSAGWDQGCVIEELVKRTGARKDGSPAKVKSKKRKVEMSDEEEEAEMSNLSDSSADDLGDWE